MGSSGQGAMGVFWAWVEGATGNIALGLGSLVEQVRSWVSAVGLEGLGLPSSMDTLNTLLVGWMLFVTLVLILGSFFYFKFIHQLDNESESMSEDAGPSREGRDQERVSLGGGGGRSQLGKAGAGKPTGERARTPTIVPRQPPAPVSPPVGTGADPDAAAWTNNVFTWLYNSPDGGRIIKKLWVDTVNENTVKTAIETGILVEVVELLPATPAPTLSNVVVDCSPTDNVTITCDCDATVYLRVVTTRTQGENTTESEYAAAVHPFRGRLNIAAVTADLTAVVKFDGWPEVALKLEGIRNNATGLDEQQMLDVISEVLTSALRNSVFDVNVKSVPTFPRFRRARQEPDRIIPVGYDSMVRELQTHPPSGTKIIRPTPAPAPAQCVKEVSVDGGKSFATVTYTANSGLTSGLTTSEEQLIARNLNKYPSLENTDLDPEEMADLCRNWQDNYVPTTDVSSPSVPEEPPQELNKDASGQNFVLVASNRSKLIDEPRKAIPLDEPQDLDEDLEDEPELSVLLPIPKPHDEPMFRRQSGSPLMLNTPKVNHDSVTLPNKEDSQEDTPMSLDQMAKSLGIVEVVPRPSLLQKDLPVSDAWCAGVAARIPPLDFRPADGVACDLECIQEDPSTHPTLPFAQFEKHPPSSSPIPLLESSACGLPVENIDEQSAHSSSCMDDKRMNLGNSDYATQTHSSTPDQDRSKLEGREWQEPDCVALSEKSKVIQCKNLLTGTESLSSHQAENDCTVDGEVAAYLCKFQGNQTTQVLPQQLSYSENVEQDIYFHFDHFTSGSNEECETESVGKVWVSGNKVCYPHVMLEVQSGNEAPETPDSERQNYALLPMSKCENIREPGKQEKETSSDREANLVKDQGPEFENESESNENRFSSSQGSDSSRFQKLCLNEFTDNLFSCIELEDSEISLPEEYIEEAAWEVTEVYEIEDGRRRSSDVNAHEQSDDDTRISDSVMGKAEDESLYSESSSDKPDTTSSLSEYLSPDSKEPCTETVVSACLKILPSKYCTSKNILEIKCSEQNRDFDENSRQINFIAPEEFETGVMHDDFTAVDEVTVSDEELHSNFHALDGSDETPKLGTTSAQSSIKQTHNKTSMDLSGDDNKILSNPQVSLESAPSISCEKGISNKIEGEGTYHGKQTEEEEAVSEVREISIRLPPKEDFSLQENEDILIEDPIEHEFEISSTDSEVEEITGSLDRETQSHLSHDRLHSDRRWRKSDIGQIVEAELIHLTPSHSSVPVEKFLEVEAAFDDKSILLSDGMDEKSSKRPKQIASLKDNKSSPEKSYGIAHIIGATSSQANIQTPQKDTTFNCSLSDVPILNEGSVRAPRQKNLRDPSQESNSSHQDTQTSHQQISSLEGKPQLSENPIKTNDITNNVLASAGWPLPLTAECNNPVATLMPTDTPDTLTCSSSTTQQHTTHMAAANSVATKTGDAYHHHHPHPPPTTTISASYYWTRPLPSYPVYGPYVTPSITSATTSQPVGIPGLNGKRLLVKIVKATGVGCEKSVSDAYAVVEMDEPPQKFTTSVAKDTNSPFWDEQFLFDLSGGTLELLFELYDRSDGNFLGLGIVGIEELVATPSQRQIIPLQSRPYENDQVSGSLTVEFLFLDRAELPEHTVRTSATSQSVGPKGALVTTTTTTYQKAIEGQDIIVNGGDGVAAAVLRDIEEKKAVVANNASKSTMIIHASRKSENEAMQEVTSLVTTGIPTTAATASPLHTATGTTTTTTVTNENADATETNDTEDRGRSRGVRRKRDSFFGTLKKRFSRSKVRSKSMEPGREHSADRDQSVGRSVSMERSANLSRASEEQPPQTPSSQDHSDPRLLSVPPGVGGGGGGDGAGSTRSSLSDASAISGSSTRTYINEASTLIIETTENGVHKHYLIPLSLQQKSKWRKKGTKLHIYGDHTFVAKHLSSSTLCEVCQKNMGRRLGKQGYACRDCGYQCHKPCHVKTETTCPSSTVNTMDLLVLGEGDGFVYRERHLTSSYHTLVSSSQPSHSAFLPSIPENQSDENKSMIQSSVEGNSTSITRKHSSEGVDRLSVNYLLNGKIIPSFPISSKKWEN